MGGWAVGNGEAAQLGQSDAESLYTKLSHEVLPMFYGDRARLIAMMKAAIAKNASYFNAHRMMQRYAVEAYVR